MRHMRSPSEARTASMATRRFFDLLDSSDVPRPVVAKKAGIHVNNFYGWKSGRVSATVLNMEAALAVLGMELCIRPIEHLTEEFTEVLHHARHCPEASQILVPLFPNLPDPIPRNPESYHHAPFSELET